MITNRFTFIAENPISCKWIIVKKSFAELNWVSNPDLLSGLLTQSDFGSQASSLAGF